jgi:hypothetical protein
LYRRIVELFEETVLVIESGSYIGIEGWYRELIEWEYCVNLDEIRRSDLDWQLRVGFRN